MAAYVVIPNMRGGNGSSIKNTVFYPPTKIPESSSNLIELAATIWEMFLLYKHFPPNTSTRSL